MSHGTRRRLRSSFSLMLIWICVRCGIIMQPAAKSKYSSTLTAFSAGNILRDVHFCCGRYLCSCAAGPWMPPLYVTYLLPPPVLFPIERIRWLFEIVVFHGSMLFGCACGIQREQLGGPFGEST
ncbi:unnamed protein product [Ectocarpus sp. 6 AP-2014]